MAAKSSQYYISDTDIAQLMAMSGLPANFKQLFARDYSALKRDIGGDKDAITSLEVRATEAEERLDEIDDHIEIIDAQIVAIDLRVTTAEGDILDLSLRVTQNESDIADNRADFDAHVIDTTTHGTTGEIVGTGNYASAAIGGTVLLAAAVADAVPSTVSITSTPNAAGVAYSQVDAATWVAMLNELKADVNTLVTNTNAAITQLNALLASERAAKQLAP
jgi:hypothetical protein